VLQDEPILKELRDNVDAMYLELPHFRELSGRKPFAHAHEALFDLNINPQTVSLNILKKFRPNLMPSSS
jgi:hypothetical protein